MIDGLIRSTAAPRLGCLKGPKEGSGAEGLMDSCSVGNGLRHPGSMHKELLNEGANLGFERVGINKKRAEYFRWEFKEERLPKSSDCVCVCVCYFGLDLRAFYL